MTSESKHAIDILVPLSGKGGVESVINQLAGYLVNQGYRVRVVQMVFNGPVWLDSGIDFYPLRREKVNDISDFTGMYEQFLEQTYVPDLVIATPWPYMTLTAKKALVQLSAASTKIVAWIHAPLEVLKKYGVGGVECLSLADKILVLNERTRALIADLLPKSVVEIVRNPVDLSKCRMVVPAEKHCMLFVGRLSEEKCVSVIIDAVKKCRTGWSLKIIGDGKLRGALERQAQELGVAERVEFLGWKANPWEHAQGDKRIGNGIRL